MLNFYFSEKGLELISPPYSVYGFSRKYSLSYILTDQINCLIAFTSRDIGR